MSSNIKDTHFNELINFLLNSVQEAMIITKNNKIIFVNDYFLKYVKCSRDETLSMSPLEFIAPEYIDIAKEKMSVLSEEPYEILAKRKDGSSFNVLLLPKMMSYNNDKYRVITVKDITKEKEYIKTELLLSKIFDQSHESIIITDDKANIIYVNNKFCKVTGYTKQEALGQNPRILKSENQSKEFYQSMWDTLVNGKEWHGEFQNKRKDGSIFWEKAIISPIFNNKKQIYSYLAIKEDITEQKKIEDNYIDTKIKYNELIDNAPLAILTIDKQGNILTTNQMMLDFLGSPSKEETMKINVLTFPPLKDKGVSAQFKKCLDTGNKIKFENNYKSKWGKTLYYRLYLTPIINNKNKITGVLAIAEDISKDKKYEKKLLDAKNKAEEADRQKDIFLANISHELRTPLNSIIGFSDILKEDENLELEQKKYAQYINEGGHHLLKLINDIIDFTTIKGKQIKINNEYIETKDLIASIIPVAKNQFYHFNKKNIELITNSTDKIKDTFIKVDKIRFTQIATNLINNAIKYTNKGSIILNYYTKNNEFIFTVKDTGIGIPKNKQKIIFERFRQADEKLSREYEGSGLGLTIATELTKLMNGRIWLESTLKKGSTFFVAFPIANKNKEKDNKKNNTTKYNDNEYNNMRFTILLVEDNVNNKIYIRNILEEYKFNILEANNGKEAVEIFKNSTNIDAILMDLQMPIMDGFEATKIIRNINPDIPIIAQTALAFQEDKENAINAGCNDILTKPFSKKELLFKVIKNIKV